MMHTLEEDVRRREQIDTYRQHSCLRKYKHATYEDALKALMSLERKNKSAGTMSVYPCYFCQKFHHGHTPSIIDPLYKSLQQIAYDRIGGVPTLRSIYRMREKIKVEWEEKKDAKRYLKNAMSIWEGEGGLILD